MAGMKTYNTAMENIYALLGQKIRHERLKTGLTQSQLAEKTDLSTAFVGQIERGHNKASLETIRKLAKALDVPLDKLFSMQENKPDYPLPFEKQLAALVRDSRPEAQKLIFKMAKLIVKEKKKI